MLNKRYTIKKDCPEFPKRYRELVVGASFEVIRTSNGHSCDGIMTLKMDSGTVYDITSDPDYWCFYTEHMVMEYLEPKKENEDVA
ncbi:hypothetical protein ASwh1_381 [Aeromonas phage Aswh_1]|nr:hypothetical protein ASwh1_381 [Aeromonas phage Aswh_1]